MSIGNSASAYASNLRVTSPEAPYFASGILVLAVSLKKGVFDKETAFKAILSSIALGIIASIASGTRYAGIVQGIGILLFIVTASLAVKNFKDISNG